METIVGLDDPIDFRLALEASLASLKPGYIPTQTQIRTRDVAALANAKRGLLALKRLQEVAFKAARYHDKPGFYALSTLITRKVGLSLGDVCKWLSFAISIPPASYLGTDGYGTSLSYMYLASTFAMDLGFLHESLGHDVSDAFNDAFFDLFIDMWLKKGSDLDSLSGQQLSTEFYIWTSPGQQAHIDWTPGQGCWLLTTVGLLSKNTRFADAFSQRWLARCRRGGFEPSSLFVSTILSRIRRIIADTRSNADHLYEAVVNIRFLSEISFNFTIPYLRDRPSNPGVGKDIFKALDKAGYIQRLTTAIRFLSAHCLEEEKANGFPGLPAHKPPAILECADILSLVVKNCHTVDNAVSSGVRSLIRHGLLEIGGNAAFALSKYPGPYRSGLPDSLFFAVDCCVRSPMLLSSALPTVSHELVNARHSLSADVSLGQDWAMRNILKIKRESDPEYWGVAVFWEHVLAYNVLVDTYSAVKSSFICDSAQHHIQSNDSSRPARGQHRECSGCSSVVYCSTRCQHSDWAARHRFECKELASFTSLRQDRKSSYHHRYRAWHISLILEHYRLDDMFGKIHLQGASDCVFQIGLFSVPHLTDSFSASAYPENLKTSSNRVHDRRLENDFLPWAKTRAGKQVHSNGDIQMERLLQGLWHYGGNQVVVDLKVEVTKPLKGDLRIVILDTLSRICKL
ncbi:hypothetical protein BKA70DRAFT_1300544 [Coprinopsis sp. MPI-PUGE-AT-0042]|nr:hypothetical protein BKA70DRAFT_1300544 [Coprinopsis sp. MPI-PUGE-AT-0042]